MEKKVKINTKNIAVAAIFWSLIMLFVFVPIQFLGIDIAFVPLIAVFIAAEVTGFGMGIFAGASFGCASLAAAFLRPTVFSPMFYNPLVSIIPRVIIPITTFFVFKLMKKLLRKRSDDASTYVASTVASAVGVITNTALVVSMMAAFNFGKTYGGVLIGKAFILSLLGVNFLLELTACSIITPIVVTGLRIALGYDKKGRRAVESSVDASELEINQACEEVADHEENVKID